MATTRVWTVQFGYNYLKENVVARTAEEAIRRAKSRAGVLPRKERWVSSVELIAEGAWNSSQKGIRWTRPPAST